jgi:hypothetical protein
MRRLRSDNVELALDGGLPHWKDMLEELHQDPTALLVAGEADSRDTETKLPIFEDNAVERL